MNLPAIVNRYRTELKTENCRNIKLQQAWKKYVPEIFAIGAGIGILLVSVIGMTYFKEPVSLMKIISIMIIVIGVVMLNLSEKIIKQ